MYRLVQTSEVTSGIAELSRWEKRELRCEYSMSIHFGLGALAIDHRGDNQGHYRAGHPEERRQERQLAYRNNYPANVTPVYCERDQAYVACEESPGAIGVSRYICVSSPKWGVDHERCLPVSACDDGAHNAFVRTTRHCESNSDPRCLTTITLCQRRS